MGVSVKKGVKLEISLFGSFDCHWSDGRQVLVTGAKQRALIAMLALAINGVHSRAWVQEHLWERSGEELGRQSLRRALSDLRKVIGPDFDCIFQTDNTDLRLVFENITLQGGPKDGVLLAGINIQEPKFQGWLSERRATYAPAPLFIDSDTRLEVSPCVAVLPFISALGSGGEKHFGDLLAMDVARALSRSRYLDVISHFSSRKLAGPRLDMLDLKAKLNADYAIGGTVRVIGDKYRLDADFIQTSTGRILWTEDFHGPMSEILNGDSDLVVRIAQKCGQEVLRASVEIASSQPLPQVAAHALFMASITGMHQHHLANFSRSRSHLEELIARLPNHSKLHAWLAKWYILSIAQGWSVDVQKDGQIAADYTARALDINPGCATSLTIDGMIQGDRKDDMSLSLARFQAATEADPNQGLAWLMFSRMNSFQGNGAQALDFAGKARRLSPIDPHGYFYDIMHAMAYVVNGDFTAATKLAQRSLRLNPRHISSYRVLAMAQQMAGQGDDARQTVKALLRLEPGLTEQSYLANHPAGRLQTGRDWAKALRDAGVPKQ